MQSNSDGSTLVPYTGADRDSLTIINGELPMLAWNVTTGHGIHAGIHFRSSSFWAIIPGELIGISVLVLYRDVHYQPHQGGWNDCDLHQSRLMISITSRGQMRGAVMVREVRLDFSPSQNEAAF